MAMRWNPETRQWEDENLLNQAMGPYGRVAGATPQLPREPRGFGAVRKPFNPAERQKATPIPGGFRTQGGTITGAGFVPTPNRPVNIVGQDGTAYPFEEVGGAGTGMFIPRTGFLDDLSIGRSQLAAPPAPAISRENMAGVPVPIPPPSSPMASPSLDVMRMGLGPYANAVGMGAINPPTAQAPSPVAPSMQPIPAPGQAESTEGMTPMQRAVAFATRGVGSTVDPNEIRASLGMGSRQSVNRYDQKVATAASAKAVAEEAQKNRDALLEAEEIKAGAISGAANAKSQQALQDRMFEIGKMKFGAQLDVASKLYTERAQKDAGLRDYGSSIDAALSTNKNLTKAFQSASPEAKKAFADNLRAFTLANYGAKERMDPSEAATEFIKKFYERSMFKSLAGEIEAGA